MRKLYAVYRSGNTEGMYLYVDNNEGLERVPPALLQRFGKPQLAMTLPLHAGRKLARADVGKVLDAIAREGFYLQMPAHPEDYLPAAPEYTAPGYPRQRAGSAGATGVAGGAPDEESN
jgi:uncharacterized protein YcgL (UPF0745 family)